MVCVGSQFYCLFDHLITLGIVFFSCQILNLLMLSEKSEPLINSSKEQGSMAMRYHSKLAYPSKVSDLDKEPPKLPVS